MNKVVCIIMNKIHMKVSVGPSTYSRVKRNPCKSRRRQLSGPSTADQPLRREAFRLDGSGMGSWRREGGSGLPPLDVE